MEQTISKKSITFFPFMESVIRQLRQSGKGQTADNYVSALSSFKTFRDGRDVEWGKFNNDLVMKYELFLKSRGITMNTISFYNRILRAVYNRAVDRGLTKQKFPFKRVYTGVDKTVKRAIPLKYVKRIKDLDLSDNPNAAFARDMFLFSFYTRGMSFVDMAYLKKSSLKKGVLTYYRRKTGQRLTVKWESCMQEIVDKYPASDTEFLLPIIKKAGNERVQYRNAMQYVNNKLKALCPRIGLQTKLTMYVSRHSWASIAKNQNIPLSVISEALGHDSEFTTRIYLTSLDTALVDRANRSILKNL